MFNKTSILWDVDEHLGAPHAGAVAAAGGSEAETAGASFWVGRVQVERTISALITARTLDVLLQGEHTHTHAYIQQCQTHKHDRLVYVCAFVYVSANLAETLSCGRVTHFLLGPRLVAVTWSAVGVTVETGGTAVALTSDDVVLTSGNRKRCAESQLL